MATKTLFHFVNSAASFLLINLTLLSSLTSSLIAGSPPPPDRPIIITFGQPNIWSLDQAHYLLARMHRENLDIKTLALGDLDPNATNSQRVDIVKTLLSMGFSYDQALGLNNQLKAGDKTSNQSLRQDLITRRTERQAESTQLARDISAAKIARSKATTDTEKAQLDSEIAAKTEEKAAVDNELGQINTQISSTTGTTGDFASPSPAGDGFDKTKLPDSALDALLKSAADKFTNGASLTASQRLSNQVNMQYELIAKQLTLLRDEVGPGERLVFLELPQSIKTSQDRANKKIAQAWWRIAYVTTIDREKNRGAEYTALGSEIAELKGSINKIEPTKNEDVRHEQEKLENKLKALLTRYEKLALRIKEDQIKKQRDKVERLWAGGSENTREVVNAVNGSLKDLKLLGQTDSSTEGRKWMKISHGIGVAQQVADRGQRNSSGVRTIDIIPRENAVNVNDTKERVNATGIAGAFSFLFGFAGKVQYQRQHDHFEQFLNQELYTSGFGKGETDFGWNFYPFAGTEQIAPGIRTTYAVAIVPEDAESLVLETRGCYMDRKDYQPINYDATAGWTNGKGEDKGTCTDGGQFIVPIPGGGNAAEFYATGMRYDPGKDPAEGSAVVSITGKNFSPNVGVLIDGVPLVEAVGLARGDVESIISAKVAATCGIQTICGRYERIDSEQMLLVFKVPDKYKGTPEITLVEPGKAVSVNDLEMDINDAYDSSLNKQPFMFGTKAAKLSIKVEDFKITGTGNNLYTGILTGNGFNKLGNIYINGEQCLSGQVLCNVLAASDVLRIIRFPISNDDAITLTLEPQNGNGAVNNNLYDNPALLRILSSTVLAYQKTATPPTASIRLDGTGFKSNLTVTASGATFKEKITHTSGVMVVKIESPGPLVTIHLTDPDTLRDVSILVTFPQS